MFKKFSLLLFITLLSASFVIAQDNAGIFVERSGELKNKGKYQEAADEISKAIKLRPALPELYLKRALLYYLLRDQTDAMTNDLLKAIELDPTNFKARMDASKYLFDFQRCETALDIINSAVVQNPTNPKVYERRASINTCLDKLDEAMRDWKKALSLDPLNDIYKHNIANTQNLMKKTENSLESFTDLINSLELKQRNRKETFALSSAYISRARIYSKNNEVDKVFSDLNRAVEINPHFHTYQIRARAFVWQKIFDKALNDYSAGIKLDPQNAAGLYLERGDIYVQLKRFDEALSDYEKVAANEGTIRELAAKKIDAVKQKIMEDKNDKEND